MGQGHLEFIQGRAFAYRYRWAWGLPGRGWAVK